MFIDELYCKFPGKNQETNKLTYNHTDEIWGIDLGDFADHVFQKLKNENTFPSYSINSQKKHGVYHRRLKTVKQ